MRLSEAQKRVLLHVHGSHDGVCGAPEGTQPSTLRVLRDLGLVEFVGGGWQSETVRYNFGRDWTTKQVYDRPALRLTNKGKRAIEEI